MVSLPCHVGHTGILQSVRRLLLEIASQPGIGSALEAIVCGMLPGAVPMTLTVLPPGEYTTLVPSGEMRASQPWSSVTTLDPSAFITLMSPMFAPTLQNVSPVWKTTLAPLADQLEP